jgi:hypothetical protein
MRVNQLKAELPAPNAADPNAAAARQELLGGKYGEMSTLGNYMFQSFNFRPKSKLKPFYISCRVTLIASPCPRRPGMGASRRPSRTAWPAYR